MGEKQDPEIRGNIAARANELFDLLQMKNTEIAEAAGISSKQLGRFRNGEGIPRAVLLYRLHDLACNKAWVLPDFFGPELEPYPDYAISRAATQFLNAPWPEWLDVDPAFATTGKRGKYDTAFGRNAAPFRFSEAMQVLVERFPPQEGWFTADSNNMMGISYSRTKRTDIPLNLHFDRAGFLSLRCQVRVFRFS